MSVTDRANAASRRGSRRLWPDRYGWLQLLGLTGRLQLEKARRDGLLDPAMPDAEFKRRVTTWSRWRGYQDRTGRQQQMRERHGTTPEMLDDDYWFAHTRLKRRTLQ